MPGQRLKLWFFGSAIAVAIIASVLLTASRQPVEPLLDGKPPSYYLDRQTYGELRTERSARETIREFGTNALPYLIEILDARESRFKVKLRELAQSQTLIRFRFTPLYILQSQAAMACQELGPLAAPAIPSLTRFVDDPVLAAAVLSSLAMIGPETFPILTNALLNGIPPARIEAAGALRYMEPRSLPLHALLHSLGDPVAAVRANAASSLGFLGCEPEMVVPALITCLDDPDASVRSSAVQGLGWLKVHAVPAIPKPLELQRAEEGTSFGQKITEALEAINAGLIQETGTE